MNDEEVRSQVLEGVSTTYGYGHEQVELRLYVGRFAAPSKGKEEQSIRDWATTTQVGSGPIQVFNAKDVVDVALQAASHKQHRDDAALVALKVLDAAGRLKKDGNS